LISQLKTHYPGVPPLPSRTLASNELDKFARIVKSNPTENELRNAAEEIAKWSDEAITTAKERYATFLMTADQGAGPDAEHKNRVAVEMRKFEKWFQGVAHHDIPASSDDFKNELQKFEHLLEALFLEYFQIEPRVRQLAEKSDPCKEDLALLRGMLAKTSLADYFFQSALSHKWLNLLREDDIFKKPVGVVEHENGAISCPFWPQAQFLIRLAEQEPKTVSEILMEVGDTENSRVHQELVEIALKLPSTLIIEFSKKASKWIKDQYHSITSLPLRLAEFAAKLAKEGELRAAFQLADGIFDVKIDEAKYKNQHKTIRYSRPPESEAYVEDWYYREMLKICDPLFQLAPIDFIDLLCSKLSKAIWLEHKIRGNADLGTDYTYIIRPAIEESDQNHGTDRLKDSLIDHIRDLTVTLVHNGMPLDDILQIFHKCKYPIFRRLELHLLCQFAETNIDHISDWISQSNNFDDIHIHHEYFKLLSKGFGLVSADLQKNYLDWVSAGPDTKDYKEWFLQKTGAEPKEDQIQSHIAIWKLRHYAPIVSFLNTEHKAIYDTLLKDYPMDEHPDYLTYSKGWTGPTSPIDDKQLGQMSIAEVIEYLAEWKPAPGHFTPSPEGLGRFLKEDVRLRAEEYSDICDTLQPRSLRPVYIFYLFMGFGDAIKDSKILAWPKIMHLSHQLAFDDQLPEPVKSIDEFETGWVAVRKEVARLLSDALPKPNLIPFKLRESIWIIIEKLSHEEEPTLDYETKYGGSNTSPVDMSINTARGVAAHAVFQYLLWVDFNVNDGIDPKMQSHSIPPEAMPTLTRLLDSSLEPSVTIRSVVTWYLCYLAHLDLNWTRNHLDIMVPIEADQRRFRDAAFEGYFSFNNPNGLLFKNLREFFERAFDWANYPNEDDRMHRPRLNYVDHLLVYYWWGIDPLDNQNCLIKKIFEFGNVKLRAHAINSAGRSLETLLPIVPDGFDALERLQQLLDWRLLQISHLTIPPDEVVAELRPFGWWFTYGQMDRQWLLDRLFQVLTKTNGIIEWTHKVLERLVEFIQLDPLKVAQILNVILRADPSPWNIDYWHKQLSALFEGIKNTGNQDAWKICVDIINFLAERGSRSFGSLL
jgi:hypothetical protein